MQKFEVNKIENLSDVFYAVMGGKPDNIKEIDAFMENSPLRQLLYTSDIVRILDYDGYFAEETVDAVYSLLPVKIPLNSSQSWVMTPKSFEKMSKERESLPASRLINIPFPLANRVYRANFNNKVQQVIEIIMEAKQKQKEKAKSQSEIEKNTKQSYQQKHKDEIMPKTVENRSVESSVKGSGTKEPLKSALLKKRIDKIK